MTVDAEMLTALLVQTFDPKADYEVIATGVPAAPGGAKGEIVFTAQEAVEAAGNGRDVVLVRPDTNANDVAGFHAAKGILTSLGGKASHAALVARGMGVPCVTAASELKINLEQRCIRVGDRVIEAGDFIAINGTNGEVTLDDVPLVDPTEDPAFDEILKAFNTVLDWADDTRRLGVRTNADTPEDARKARELGAQGIGLCRTEHMFMAEDRQPKMRAMIMADGRDERKDALAELLPLQQEDFEGLFEAMKGLPVTIRLLDPPLHEFLPDLPELAAQVERARIEETDDLQKLERLLETTERISEENPMPARNPLPRDLRDAGARDPARGEGDGRASAPRDHDPARRLRARDRADARVGGPDRRRGGAARGRGLHRRHHDRVAPCVFCCRSDCKARGFFLFRHK
jgi:pyruvate,orthophosphate dikinase